MAKKISVKQNPENEVAAEVLADSIVAISVGIKKLRAGRFNEKALMLLIQHAAPTVGYNKKVSVTDIRSTLDGIESLERIYLKKASHGG